MKRLPLSKPITLDSAGFGLVDLVIAYQENGQADKAQDAAQRCYWRRDETSQCFMAENAIMTEKTITTKEMKITAPVAHPRSVSSSKK